MAFGWGWPRPINCQRSSMKMLQPVWLAALPVAAVVTMSSLPALAQDKAAPSQAASAPDRAQIRKETAAANKAHRIDHGEAGQDNSAAPPDKSKAAQSTVKRADIKKETAAANKAGTLAHGELEGKPATKP